MASQKVQLPTPARGPESAELGVLGLLVFEPDTVYEILPKVRPEHFADPKNAKVLSVIRSLYDRGAYEPGLLKQELVQRGVFDEAEWEEFLIELARHTPAPGPEQIKGLLNALKKHHARRVLKILGERLAHDEESEPEVLVEYALEKLYAALEDGHGESTNDAKNFTERLRRYVENVTGAVTVPGIPTFRRLDEIITGLHPGQLVVVAARPGMGKTSFALSLFLKSAKRGFTPAFFSLEMDAESLGQRMLSILAGVRLQDLRRGRLTSAEQARLEEALFELERLSYYVDDSPSLSLGELRMAAKKLVREKGVDVIFVDYLQLVKSPFKNHGSRQEEVAEISRGLKALAKELGVPVVALAQLSRQVEQRTDKRPQLSDLRESGQIEQDADVILFIHRPEYYFVSKKKDVPEDVKNKAEVIVAKHRQGPTGTVELYFDHRTTAFEDPTDEPPLSPELREAAAKRFGLEPSLEDFETPESFEPGDAFEPPDAPDLPDLPGFDEGEDLGIDL